MGVSKVVAMEFSLYVVQSESSYRQAERIARVHTVLIEGSYVLSPSVTQLLFHFSLSQIIFLLDISFTIS